MFYVWLSVLYLQGPDFKHWLLPPLSHLTFVLSPHPDVLKPNISSMSEIPNFSVQSRWLRNVNPLWQEVWLNMRLGLIKQSSVPRIIQISLGFQSPTHEPCEPTISQANVEWKIYNLLKVNLSLCCCFCFPSPSSHNEAIFHSYPCPISKTEKNYFQINYKY